MTRILVIEDEEMVRDTFRQVLERAGYEVEVASNGKDGIARQIAQPADLVITDIIMPEKDGVETTIELKRRFPATRVIAMSGGGRIKNMDFLKQAKAVGADAILAKPFTRSELLEVVTGVLGKKAG
jgi:CheY-like chemotaxis protein